MSEANKNDSSEPLVGKIIDGRYEVLKLLGKGGMGKVFQVRHKDLEKILAMKTLHQHLTHDPSTVERFKREAKAASRIGSEHIIEMTDYGEDPDAGHYFVMEFLEGLDLSGRLEKYGPMHYSEACHVLLQVCDALALTHAQDIIHRDLKPENLVLVDIGRRADVVKILDFGIAAMKGAAEEGAEKLTQAGTIFGTPTYMSPEQAYGMDLDNRTDIYSLGCMLYEMVTGFVPFKADHPLQVLDMHLNVAPTPPTQVRPDLAIPPPLEAVILRAMAKNRDERYQSVREIQQAVLSFYQPGATPITSHRGNRPMTDQDLISVSTTLAQPRVSGMPNGAGMYGAGPGLEEGPSFFNKRMVAILAGALVLVAAVVTALLLMKGQAGDTRGLTKRTTAEALAASEKKQEEIAVRERREEEDRRSRELAEATRRATEAAEAASRLAEVRAAAVPAVPAAPTTVAVTFNSDPEGASVYFNGELLGATNFQRSFPISESSADFVFKKDGYEDYKVSIPLSAAATVDAAMKKEEAAPAPAVVKASEDRGSGTRPTASRGGRGRGGRDRETEGTRTGRGSGRTSGRTVPLGIRDDFQ